MRGEQPAVFHFLHSFLWKTLHQKSLKHKNSGGFLHMDYWEREGSSGANPSRACSSATVRAIHSCLRPAGLPGWAVVWDLPWFILPDGDSSAGHTSSALPDRTPPGFLHCIRSPWKRAGQCAAAEWTGLRRRTARAPGSAAEPLRGNRGESRGRRPVPGAESTGR